MAPAPSAATLPMERRMRALIRKADPELPAACKAKDVKDSLVAKLAALITNKRAYNDLFETPEATESFGIRHCMSEEQKQLLFFMQANKDIFVPNAILDFVCTAIFLLECAFVVWDLVDKHLFFVFIGLLFITDCVISRVKLASFAIGRRLSAWVHRLGLVDVDPLAGRIQMKKWTEQSWQLFVHVTFAIMEARILAEEPWYDDPATCWIPHPFDQAGSHRTDLVVLYLTQLVRQLAHSSIMGDGGGF